MRSRPRADSQHAYLRGISGHQGRRAPVNVAGKVVLVPEWVANSAYSKAQLLAPEPFPVPRFVRVPREHAPPVHLQGVRRFRQAGGGCRCVVPRSLMYSTQSVLEAIYEAECFPERLA